MSQQPTTLTRPPVAQRVLDAAGLLAAAWAAWFSALVVGGAQGGVPTGAEMLWRGASAPEGYLFEQGQVVARADYPALWTWAEANAPVVTDAAWLAGAFGSFSSGDGAATFRLPDSRGRAGIGAGTGSGGLTARALGAVGGAETHTLTNAELPNPLGSHIEVGGSVPIRMDAGAGAGVRNVAYTAAANAGNPLTVDNTGGGGAHANMQPWFASNWIIKT